MKKKGFEVDAKEYESFILNHEIGHYLCHQQGMANPVELLADYLGMRQSPNAKAYLQMCRKYYSFKEKDTSPYSSIGKLEKKATSLIP